MSSQPRISDEEMQIFQFKARKMFLQQKEDHNWNQFCRTNKCTCSMCESLSTNKSKEIGIQTSSTNVPTRINRNINIRTGIQNRNLPQTLNEIKTKLDKLDLSLSQMQLLPQNEAVSNQQPPDLEVPISSNASGRITLNDKRLEIIQNTLKGSLQRLQSTAAWKGKPIPSVNGQKKSSGFVLPRELQEQRIIARRAYLASLAKLGTKNKTTKDLSSDPNAGKANKRVDQKQIVKGNKSFPKPRSDLSKKPILQQKKEGSIGSNIITAVQTSEIKDENIENAVDAIVDDLLGETVLTLNKIKHMKSKKTLERSVGEIKNWQQTKPSQTTDEDDSHIQQKNHWEKIRGNLFKLKTAMSNNIVQNRNKQSDFPDTFLSQNTIPKTILKDSSKHDKRTKLFIDSKSAKEISKQKKEFWKYLERISRTKKGNFDPWALSNMISESLLDDCILDVCKELQDIPTSLVTELYDQEFLQSL